MINFDDYTNENDIVHNEKWPYIPDHPYQILTIGNSGSGKTNALSNLIKEQPNIDKMYLYAKDPYKPKYQFLINKRESTELKHFDDPNALLNIQMICMMFIKILMNTTQVKNVKY